MNNSAVKKKGKILIVDDEKVIRMILTEFLTEKGYLIKTAPDGIAALEMLAQETFDLVLSDVNMPRMKGFELMGEIKKHYPHIKRALITSYHVEDYIRNIKEHDVGSLIVKSTPFDYDDVGHVVDSLVSERIWGLEKFFAADADIKINKIKKYADINHICEMLSEKYGKGKEKLQLRIVLHELITNALFYGVLGEKGDKKEEWDMDFSLDDSNCAQVSYCDDQEKYGISILDPGGKLKKQDILFWLDRQITKDEAGLPLGVEDEHGRGIFISRQLADRMVVNIKPQEKTEIIILNYANATKKQYKPLIINEI